MAISGAGLGMGIDDSRFVGPKSGEESNQLFVQYWKPGDYFDRASRFHVPVGYRHPATFPVQDDQSVTTLCLGTVGRSNYIGMYGTGEIPDFPDTGEGIFFRNSAIRIADITDGTSNTIAVGERASNLAMSTWTGAVTNGIVKNLSGIPGSDDQPWPVFVLGHTGTAIEGQLPNNTTGHADDFTSRHAGGVNFLFADGSVRFISNNIDTNVWVSLGTRAGKRDLGGKTSSAGRTDVSR